MKKYLILVVVFILFGDYLFSQTWTTRDENWDVEWSEISKEAWNRLLSQKEAEYRYAFLFFTDVLENRSSQVIKGTPPPLSGYYYLLGTYKPRTDVARTAINLYGGVTGLKYGNGRTGSFGIRFFNSSMPLFDNIYYIGSDSYNQRYNQCIRWVNGE
jgi:hypothetical protein